ncbi:hypothetical protein FKM82_023600 [Ascaphus truei]
MVLKTHDLVTTGIHFIITVTGCYSFKCFTHRQGVERIFCDIKEEFSQICKLTREQSNHLNKFVTKKETAAEVHLQFSMPIQCTDEANGEAQGKMKATVKKDQVNGIPFASITPRGLGPDDETSISVESLSNLSVKFPPTDDDCDFLQSTPEKLPALNPVLAETIHPNKSQAEAALLPKNFSTTPSSLPESQHTAQTICKLENLKYPDVGINYGNTFSETEDSSLFLAANSPVRKYANTFCIKEDASDVTESVEVAGRTVRGPQQVNYFNEPIFSY